MENNYHYINKKKKKKGFGECIFFKYYAYDDDFYSMLKKIPLPGWKKGLSASILSGLDIGVSKYISEEKQKASFQVLEFFLRKEEQRKMIISNKVYSGIQELYNGEDKEICAAVDCEFYRNAQLTLRYHYELLDNKEYYKKFRKYVMEFIKGETTAAEALNSINDLLFIHTIGLTTEETSFGLILFTLIMIFFFILLVSGILIHTPRFKPLFKFLPIDFWWVIIIGIVFLTCTNVTDYGQLTSNKCRFKIFLYSIGYTLTFVPLLYKLIVNFPVMNKRSKWIRDNRYMFLTTFILGDTIMAYVNIGSTYGLKTIQSSNGRKYQQCEIQDPFSKFALFLIIGYKAIIFLTIGFFAFVEWNITGTKFDVHLSVSTIYINTLSMVMILVFQSIKLNNYITYCILNKIFTFTIILTNYFVFLGIRIVMGVLNKKDKDKDPFENMKEFKKNQSYSHKSSPNATTTTSTFASSTNSSGLHHFKKVISYHYQTNISQ